MQLVSLKSVPVDKYVEEDGDFADEEHVDYCAVKYREERCEYDGEVVERCGRHYDGVRVVRGVGGWVWVLMVSVSSSKGRNE